VVFLLQNAVKVPGNALLATGRNRVMANPAEHLASEPGPGLPGRHARKVPSTPLLTLIVIAPLAASACQSLSVPLPRPVSRPGPPRCAEASGACGFPDTTTAGVSVGTSLRAVPGQVSHGPGWSYDPQGWVEVTGDGAVLSGLSIRCDLNIDASGVTVKDVRVITAGTFGISLRHTSGVTIERSTVSGLNPTYGRVDTAIDDVYGDSTGTVIEDDNISYFRTAVDVSSGVVAGNYIHSPGYMPGDHTNGIYDNGSDAPLTIEDNTILNPLAQTDAITLDATSGNQTVANKTIEGNLLAGGGYAIYGGDSEDNKTSNIVIKDNWFSQRYYSQGGRYGPAAYFDPAGTGNVWSGNVWARPAPGGGRPGGYRQLAAVPAP
jgi:hypothetical protein